MNTLLIIGAFTRSVTSHVDTHADFVSPWAKLQTPIPMPRFIVTTKMRKNTNGVFIEPGMSVEIVTQSPANPVITNGGMLVQERFLALYGVDLKRAGALNMMCLDVKQA